MKTGITIIALYLTIVGLCLYGWVNNIVKFSKCNFAPSYKTEIIRGIGIPVAPLGIVLGFIDMDDNIDK